MYCTKLGLWQLLSSRFFVCMVAFDCVAVQCFWFSAVFPLGFLLFKFVTWLCFCLIDTWLWNTTVAFIPSYIEQHWLNQVFLWLDWRVFNLRMINWLTMAKRSSPERYMFPLHVFNRSATNYIVLKFRKK